MPNVDWNMRRKPAMPGNTRGQRISERAEEQRGAATPGSVPNTQQNKPVAKGKFPPKQRRPKGTTHPDDKGDLMRKFHATEVKD